METAFLGLFFFSKFANLFACSVWCSEAEERAKKEAEEQAQQEEAMEPQEVQTEVEQFEAKEDTLEGEESESAEGGRPPDGTTGETEQETQEGSDKSPPLQNGTSCVLCLIPGQDAQRPRWVWLEDSILKNKVHVVLVTQQLFFSSKYI